MSLSDTARAKAIEILEGNLTERGLMASRDWYPEVFARDSAISFIGACLLREKRYYDALKATIRTLAEYQTEYGLLPACVHSSSGLASFGSLDTMLWFVVLGYLHYTYTGDKDFLAEQYPRYEAAVRYLQCNGREPDDGIYSQESDDWGDHWPSQGQVLFVNAVYPAVLKYMAVLASAMNREGDSAAWKERSRRVRERINQTLWAPRSAPARKSNEGVSELPVLENMRDFVRARGPMRHYLAFVSRGQVGSWCDVMGNSMAICFGLSDEEKAGSILDYFRQAGVDEPYPAVVLYPPVPEGSPMWREYLWGNNLNLPYHYHNGAAWPHCGGFFVAAHAKAGRAAEAERQLEKLAEFNRLGMDGEWQFVEWAHGQNGRPWGSRFMSWSAGMYIYAQEAVKDLKVLEALDPKL